MQPDSVAGNTAMLEVLNAISDGFVILDRQRRFLFINRRAEEILQRPRQELAGRVIWDAFPGTVGSIFHEQYEAAFREQRAVEFEGYYEPRGLMLRVRANPTEQGLAIHFQDISGERRTEAERQLWADAFAHAVSGIAITDPATNTIRTANAAYLAMHGYTLPEVTGLSLLATYAPEERGKALEFLAVADRDGRVSFESVHIRQDGYRFPVQMDIVTIRGASGRPGYRVTNVQDLTRRKQAEAERTATEQLLRSAVDVATGPLFLKDRESRYVLVNTATAKAFGQPGPSAVEGRYDHEMVPPDVAASLVAADQRVLATGQPEVGEELVTDSSGEARVYLTTKVPWRNAAGETIGIHGSAQDITARKRAEEALLASEAKLRNVLRSIDVGVWEWDIANERLQFSSRWLEMMGLTARGEQWTVAEWIPFIHPDDHGPAVATVQEHLAGATPVYQTEFRVRHGDGTWHWVLDRGVAIRDEAGNPYRMVGSHTDITERKLAEQALREREERYRLVVRATNDVIWDWNLITGQIDWNPSLHDRFGYDWRAIEPTAAWWQERIHPDDRERVVESIQAALTGTAENWSEEYRFLCADGSSAEVLDRGIVARDATGRAVRMVGSMLDLTERNRREAERRRTEHLLDAVLDALPVAIIIADQSGQIVRMNRACDRVWGKAPLSESIENYGDWVGYWPYSGRRVQAHEWPLARAVRHGEVSNAEIYQIEQFHGGQRRTIEISAGPVRDEAGKILGGVVACMDITERAAAEQAVRASEATLSAVLDALPVGVLIAGAEGRLLRDNGAHREMWGVAPETVNWEQYGEWVGFWPETGARIQAHEWAMTRALLQGETVKGELVEYQPFGSTDRRFFLNNAAPIYDSAGKLIAAVVAELEVTKQRQAEQALRQLNVELEQFAWAASHDLQEPLRMVTTYSQLLSRRLSGQLDRESVQYLEIMTGSVSQMRRLIADLQTYLEAGQEAPEPHMQASLATVCGRAEEALRDLIGQSGAILTYESLPRVPGRESQLLRVFQILFANAIHHSRRGVPPEVRVTAERSGPDWVVRVRDNGVGIPPEHRERIFGVFKRLTRSVPGTGMGLAICRKIVAAHGGSIWVEAGDEPGSTFCVRLPAGERNAG